MRIAFVTETYPPEINGVAMSLKHFVQGLLDRRHEIEIVRPRQGKHDHSRIEGHLEHVTLPSLPLPKYDGLRFGLPAKNKLVQRWRYRRPDIVQISTEGPLGLTALWAARKLHIPISSGFHTNFQTYTQHYGFSFLHKYALKYLRSFHNATQATIVPSQDVVDYLSDNNFLNLHIVGRGVDTDVFSPAKRNQSLRDSWGAKPDDLVCTCVSRIAEEKNIPLVIKTFRNLQKNHPNAKLVLTGDGPTRKTLQQLNPDIIFAGMQTGEDLAKHYASADLFLFASETETFGNVITEAMSSGLAVVSYDYAAAMMHITSKKNGITAEMSNEDAFIQAAIELANNPALITSVRQQAFEYAKKLSWSSIAEQLEHIFINVINTEVEQRTQNRQTTVTNTTVLPSNIHQTCHANAVQRKGRN